MVAVTSLDSLTDPLKDWNWAGKTRVGGMESVCLCVGWSITEPLLMLKKKNTPAFFVYVFVGQALNPLGSEKCGFPCALVVFTCMCMCVWWAAAEWGSVLKHHPVYSTHVTSVSHSASLGGQLWLVLQNKCCWNCEHIAVNTQQDVASWRSALRLRLVEINQMWNIVESK